MKVIKIITAIFFLASISSISVGIISSLPYSEKLIGFGAMGLFFIVFPLFSYYRWKDKDMRDYMITKENIDKMRESQKRHKF